MSNGYDSHGEAASRLTHLLVNGRFLSRQLSGVDRTAQELVRALAALAGDGRLRLDCAVPGDAPDDAEIRDRLALPASSRILRSRWTGYAFEQVALSRLEPEAILLSLCNMGPVNRSRQLVLIHDAQVHDAPSSYSPAFRAAYRLLQPPLARNAAYLATVSDHSRTRLAVNGIGRDRTAAVVPNGVDHLDRIEPDPSILTRLDLAAGGYALALSHPAPHKNLALLRQIYGVGDAGLPPLVLVGQQTEPPFAAGVVCTGRVSDAQLKALYGGARMFLFPSLTEGFGFPALEAMSCGCPVLAARAGAIPEVVGDAAVLLDPHDAEGWRKAMVDLNGNAARRSAMAAAGREQAARFTWDAAARQVLALIEGVATSGSGSRSFRQTVPA